MPDVVVAALLGLIQGLTEFVPVSSTAHLAAAERLFRLDPERFGLAFNVAIHLGTALAVLLYFARTWLELGRDVLARRWKLPALIVAGTMPAALAGLLLQPAVEGTLRDIRYIAVALVVGSAAFALAERFGTQQRPLAAIGWRDAVLMGAAQATALVPGISRSGITISAGLTAGLARGDATRFSFLLATPIILGAGAKTLLDARHAAGLFAQPDVVAAGFTVSFLSGLAAVHLLVRFLRNHSLNWFVPYRLVLAILLAAVTALGIA